MKYEKRKKIVKKAPSIWHPKIAKKSKNKRG